MNDDRAEFLDQRRANSVALGRDEVTFAATVEAVMRVDKYRYPYLWTWLGIPIIQLPADIIATQEVIWESKPDVIIETGVARGGSVVFMASLLQIIGKGRVIGVDIDIRPHNRASIAESPLSNRIDLVQGPSTSPEVVDRVKGLIPDNATVMVVLDSDHSRDHVLDELRNYGPLVTPGQHIVVADTLLGRLTPEQTPSERSKIWKPGNEPLSALRAFLAENQDFEPDEAINGKLVFSSSPGGYVKRKS